MADGEQAILDAIRSSREETRLGIEEVKGDVKTLRSDLTQRIDRVRDDSNRWQVDTGKEIATVKTQLGERTQRGQGWSTREKLAVGFGAGTGLAGLAKLLHDLANAAWP